MIRALLLYVGIILVSSFWVSDLSYWKIPIVFLGGFCLGLYLVNENKY